MLKYAAQVRGASRMIPLKPRGRLRSLPAGFDQAIDVFPENGIGQYVLDLIARGGLQDDPGVMRDLPQFGIKLPPHFVGGMIPRPTHIQGEFRQGIESLNFRGEEMVYGVADTRMFAHDLSLRSGVPARVSPTIACASSRMRLR